MKVLIVKVDGELYPQAGCWKDTDNGRRSAELYKAKDKEAEVVEAELTEVNK